MSQEEIERFVEERELRVLVALDVSASMDFGSGPVTKRRTACEALAALSMSAARWASVRAGVRRPTSTARAAAEMSTTRERATRTSAAPRWSRRPLKRADILASREGNGYGLLEGAAQDIPFNGWQSGTPAEPGQGYAESATF